MAKSRGICANCFASYHAAVKSGRTSWKFLIDTGLALDTYKGFANKALLKAEATRKKRRGGS